MKILKIQDLLNIKEYKTRARMKLQDLVGKTVVITSFTPKQSSRFNKAGYKVQLHSEGKDIEAFTCAAAVVEQLNQLKLKLSELPSTGPIGIACIVQKNGESLYLEEYSKKESNEGGQNVSASVQET